MKSSTIRRSTLSKESMEVIENLSKEQEENGIGEYVRPDEINASSNTGMSQEIDLLWQNFKTNQFNTNSPVLHVFIGILIGILASVSVLGVHHYMVSKGNSSTAEQAPVSSVEEIINDNEITQTTGEQSNIQDRAESVAPVDSSSAQSSEGQVVDGATDTSNMTKYVVKSGDTIESIIKKHYGTYSPDKAEQIMQVNNMKSLDRINIDQEIFLP